MRAIKYRELKRMYDASGPQQTVKHLQEALIDGHLMPEYFSIREWAKVTLGGERVRQMDPRLKFDEDNPRSLPHVDAMKAFADVVRCLVYAVMMKAATQEAFVVSKLVDTTPAEIPFDDDHPQTTKRGFIVPVTKEAIFFDRTQLILDRAAEVGEVLGLNKEKRLIDVVVGISNDYTLDDRGYNTYSSTGAAPDGDWINQLDDNELMNWPNVLAAEQCLFNMGALPDKIFQVAESRLAFRRIVASGVPAADAKKWWFIGDFKKAFAYMENWPITVVQSSGHPDCVLRFKASERGAAAVTNPRYVVKSTGGV